MALEIRMASSVPAGIEADRRLYLASDQKTVVEEGDAGAAYLLAAPGSIIPAATVAELDLSVVDGRVVQAAQPAESTSTSPASKSEKPRRKQKER